MQLSKREKKIRRELNITLCPSALFNTFYAFCFRILVLDAGEIREFDSPASLIKQQSVFYGMAKDAGLA